MWHLLLPTLFFLGLLLACDTPATPENAMPTVTPVAAPGVPVVTMPDRTAISTQTPVRLAMADGISGALRATIEHVATSQKLQIVPAAEQADVIIGTELQPGALLLAEQIYAVADWFPTVRAGSALADLLDLWQGRPTPYGLYKVLVSDETASGLYCMGRATYGSTDV
jgi:hypothetical protein